MNILDLVSKYAWMPALAGSSLCTYFVQGFFKKDKLLIEYSVTSQLIADTSKTSNNLELRLNGNLLESLHAIHIKFQNKGSREINNVPIVVDIADGEIVSCVFTIPSNEEWKVTRTAKKICIPIGLFKKSESFCIQLQIKNSKRGKVFVDSRSQVQVKPGAFVDEDNYFRGRQIAGLGGALMMIAYAGWSLALQSYRTPYPDELSKWIMRSLFTIAALIPTVFFVVIMRIDRQYQKALSQDKKAIAESETRSIRLIEQTKEAATATAKE
jgi:hypothetical protein